MVNVGGKGVGEFVVYSTIGCHLCDVAMGIVNACALLDGATVCSLDIGEDNNLIREYGIRIPVIRHVQSGMELGWPFDAEQLHTWVKSL